jgi:uncharacterized protein YjbI with pentapeptide repeats
MSSLRDAASITAVGLPAFAIAIIGAAATFLIGLLNYRRQGQSLDTQKEFQDLQIDLMRSAEVTDRFTRAIDQLGSEVPHVRMGGIFALERIARDSPGDRQYVIDTLAAFVRGRLPNADVGQGGFVRTLQVRAPDAQAALTVLCRSPLSDERVAAREAARLDLSRTDLRRADLRRAHLERVNLYGARLEGADLREAHLEESVLVEANFGTVEPGGSFWKRGADLSGADLTGANTERAHNLDEAVTEGAIGLPS